MISPKQPARLNKTDAGKVVKEISKDPFNVIVTVHGNIRRGERRISHEEIVRVIQKGYVVQEPEIGNEGDWVVNIFSQASGRYIEIAVAIDWPNALIVVTAIDKSAKKNIKRR